MSDSESTSFWSALPNTVKALAALLTAMGGLLVGLQSVGLLDGDETLPPDSVGAETGPTEVLSAPNPVHPVCGSVLNVRESLTFRWTPVEDASTYTVEVDCYRCRGDGDEWYSLTGEPWYERTGLGIRTPDRPRWSGAEELFRRVRQADGLMIRWRAWAVGHQGSGGEPSEWCQHGLTG